jgi:CheY-like chemotaxis protein
MTSPRSRTPAVNPAGLAPGVVGGKDAAAMTARAEQAHRAQAQTRPLPALAADESINPLRIMVVEDDAIIAMLTAETLEAMGHQVCAIVGNETDAVFAAKRDHPDLLIVDANLDEGDGISAVRRILLNRRVPHIFISGDVLSAGHLDAEAIVLQKPFQEQDLARAIRQAFAGPRI